VHFGVGGAFEGGRGAQVVWWFKWLSGSYRSRDKYSPGRQAISFVPHVAQAPREAAASS